MSTSVLASLGLTLSNLNSFGFGPEVAASIFGSEAVRSFIAAEANLTNVPQTLSTGDLFTFAQTLDARSAAIGGNANATQQLLNVDNILQAQTGSGIEDISVTTDGNGNITASLDGVEGATNTVNINDILAQALDMI